MNKTLINSEEEYRKFVFRIIQAIRGEIDLWEGFDKDKLKLAFVALDCIQGYDEDKIKRYKNDPVYKEALEYYFQVIDDVNHKKHSDFVIALRDAGSHEETILEAFGVKHEYSCYDYDDDGNEIDEDGNILEDDLVTPESLVFEEWVKDFTYPLIVLHSIEASWDRCGDTFMCCVEMVELKEFNV